MDKFLIAPTFLRLVKEGRFFRTVFAWILRIQSGLAILAGLLVSIELWKQASGLSTASILGLIVLQLTLIVTVYLVSHLSWLRATDLLAMSETQADPISVTRLLLKLSGEIYASILAPLSVGGALLIWISAGEAGDTLRVLFSTLLPVAGGSVFQTGLTILGMGLTMAACSLLGAYALAAFIGLFVSIEQNTRKG